MIKCIIVDDEPLALAQLKSYIERVSFLQCVGEFTSAADAMSFLAEDSVDAMFLDINMPDISGLQLVRSLAAPPKVVFTTAYSEYALEGFKVDAVDYLLKPFGFDDFLRAAGKVNDLCLLQQTAMAKQPAVSELDSEDSLFVKSDYRMLRVPIHSIKYVESMSEYVRIFVDSEPRPIVSLLSMKKIEDVLPKNSFMRVHRSYIVNLNKVKEVSRMRIVFENSVFIPIGEMYKDNFFEYVDRHFVGKK